MSSPSYSFRPGGPLLLQEEPYALAPRGTTLSTLMRRRSSFNLVGHGSGRDEEEGVGFGGGSPMPPGMANTPGGGAAGLRSEAGGRLSRRGTVVADEEDLRRLHEERRLSTVLNNPHMRSMRLIGKAKRYRWERYWKTEEQLKTMTKPLRAYYERNNMLIQQYLYIDRLLDSSLPHDLLNEYQERDASRLISGGSHTVPSTTNAVKKVKRTPRAIYRPAETTPLLESHEEDDDDDEDHHDPDDDAKPDSRNTRNNERTRGSSSRNSTSIGTAPASYGTGSTPPSPKSKPPNGSSGQDNDAAAAAGSGAASPTLADIPVLLEDDEGVDSDAPVVTVAIYVNLAANAVLLAGKAIVVLSVPSISVLASLVDAVLDFLSTAIVWTTTWLISNQDQYRYPVGRRRLEPLGVLVFSVIMITSFVQVMLEAAQRLASGDHAVIELGTPALIIMLSTIVVKGLCWLWCRMVKNSSVQALAADAATDVIFNAGSIAFPIVGYYARIWWLDALGGLLLSLVVIYNWSRTSVEHIKHLSGFSATADQRNILLYLTMRFAKTIRAIQGLQAYHAGDKLIVEVDIVLDGNMSLKDSHDLSESLQYVIESVPIVDRAFVHADYADYNLPTHMEQQAA